MDRETFRAEQRASEELAREAWLPRIENGFAVTSDGHEYGHGPDGSIRRVDPISRLKTKDQRRRFRKALKDRLATAKAA